MQDVLHVFPSEKKIGEFLNQALKAVPGSGTSKICFRGISEPVGDLAGEQCLNCATLREEDIDASRIECKFDGQKGIRVFPMETAERLYGYLLMTTENEEEFTLYIPYILNMANLVAVNLENRWQKRKLESTNDELRNEIGERIRAEREKEHLIEELQEALAKVRTLSGLLPICASCKKIRDDKGYWNQIEVYIRDHSEAEFSHGICPDCMKELYPQFVKNDD
jgi:hypothetical protein